MNVKYAALAAFIQATLRHYRIVAQTGLVSGAYCPGSYDLAIAGKKIAGLSQHWFRNSRGIHCVVTAASINIEEAPEKFADVVNHFYSCAGSTARCHATVITNLRLCDVTGAFHGSDFGAAVMEQLGSTANRPGMAASR